MLEKARTLYIISQTASDRDQYRTDAAPCPAMTTRAGKKLLPGSFTVRRYDERSEAGVAPCGCL